MLQEILEVYNFIHRRNLRISQRGICGGQRILGGAEHTFIVSKLAASVCVRACVLVCVRARLSPLTSVSAGQLLILVLFPRFLPPFCHRC